MLSENIRSIRESRGLSQEELAIKLNVVRQTVSKWERGLSVPDSDMLISISEALDASVGTLLGEGVSEPEADGLSAIAEKLEVVNLQLARGRESRRRLVCGGPARIGHCDRPRLRVPGRAGKPVFALGLRRSRARGGGSPLSRIRVGFRPNRADCVGRRDRRALPLAEARVNREHRVIRSSIYPMLSIRQLSRIRNAPTKCHGPDSEDSPLTFPSSVLRLSRESRFWQPSRVR